MAEDFDSEEHEENVYGSDAREELEENDEISPEEEAFMEGYHVMETHPQLNPPGATKEMLRQMNPAMVNESGARDNPLKTKTNTEADARHAYFAKLADLDAKGYLDAIAE